MSTMIQIGLVGLGFVGQGVVDILTQNAALFEQRLGQPIRIKTVAVRDVSKPRDIDLPSDITITDSVDSMLTDPDISILVEVMGGEHPAYDIIKRALSSGKVVITANKEVVGKHQTEFFELAKANQTDIYFEAAVGGGIPLVRALKVGYAANHIQSFYGILNGTTNYILTRIEEDQNDFLDVLAEAQRLGFAEADPSMDVDGLDAAYKLVILAGVAFKIDVSLNDVFYDGITSITLTDIRYASELGYRIKLLAKGRRTENGIVLTVHPTMLDVTHPLATVRNELNALFLVGDFVGESMLLGKGAGGSPTASAVVSDIIDSCFNYGTVTTRNLETLQKPPAMLSITDTESQFYLRLTIEDFSGALEKLTHVFSHDTINIKSILQKDGVGSYAEVVMVTYPVNEAHMQASIQAIQQLDSVKSVDAVIRVGLGA